MSEDYFKSTSDSYTSSSEYKPFGYTDFSSQSSSSHNYDSDSYKRFDDYSGYSSDNNNNQNQNNSYSFDNSTNMQDSYYSPYTNSSSETDSSSNNIYQVPMYDMPERQPQQTNNIPNNNIPVLESLTVTPRKLQNLTIRDVLELPLQRQQYLKTLSIQNLKIQPEYTTIMKRPQVVLGIVDYYEKIIPDPNFNSQVKDIKQAKQIKEISFLASMLLYIWSAKSDSRTGIQKKIFESRFHLMIPVGMVGLMLYSSAATRHKTQKLINDQRNVRFVDIAVRKFICDANQKEKMIIFGQS